MRLPFIEHKRHGLQHALLLSAFWFVVLTGINAVIENDIRHILAYAVPVGWISWYGLKPGFIVAACAVLSALIGGAIPSHPELGEPLYVEGLYAYGKLTAVALGARLGRTISRRNADQGTQRRHEHDDI